MLYNYDLYCYVIFLASPITDSLFVLTLHFFLLTAGYTLSWNAGASFRIGKNEKKPTISNDYEMRIQQLEEKNAELERKVNQLLVIQGK